jgi:hypothetical protein
VRWLGGKQVGRTAETIHDFQQLLGRPNCLAASEIEAPANEVMAQMGQLQNIDHIVILMLENRSFDCLLGKLYGKSASFDGSSGTEQILLAVRGRGMSEPANRPSLIASKLVSGVGNHGGFNRVRGVLE